VLRRGDRDPDPARPDARGAHAADAAERFGITEVADPLGGSWYVEHLTDRLEAEARLLMDEVESLGVRWRDRAGLHAADDRRRGYEKQRRIASGEDVVWDVNAFEDESAPSPERFDVRVPETGSARRLEAASRPAATARPPPPWLGSPTLRVAAAI